jgi:hypothetical protein
MCLALLFAFSSPGAAAVAAGNAGESPRDATYFNNDGALTSYGRGILIFNAVWISWRVLVLLASWWVLSAKFLSARIAHVPMSGSDCGSSAVKVAPDSVAHGIAGKR